MVKVDLKWTGLFRPAVSCGRDSCLPVVELWTVTGFPAPDDVSPALSDPCKRLIDGSLIFAPLSSKR